MSSKTASGRLAAWSGCLVLAALGALLLAPAGALGANPIPQVQSDLNGLTLFSGHTATPHRVPAPRIPQNPFMAPNGRSNVHDDAYMSDTYTFGGPLGRSPRVFSQAFGGIGSCGITIVFDRRGRLITTCISPTTVSLRMYDPKTLDMIASYPLPPRMIPPGTNPFQSAGGAYFYLDNHDRAVVSINREMFVIAAKGNSLKLIHHFDLSSVIPTGDQLNSALPDWKGRLWFVTRRNGIVGVMNRRTGHVYGTRNTHEPIENSFAMDETGGVYIVTDKAQYRFDATRRNKPKVSWRSVYGNIGIQKPGQFSPGSGTTPTAMGRKYLSIADNADPMNVVVYRRAKRLHRGQRRVVCRQPVFQKGAGDTENSIIATDKSMVVENNYGYFPPPTATTGGGTSTPGVERVDIKRGGHGCRKVWHSNEISPSTVPKLSLRTGLVYTYTKPAGLPDQWYVTAIDFRSGRTVWRRLIGTGLLFNVHYAGLTISRAGVLYSGVLGGTIGLADTPGR